MRENSNRGLLGAILIGVGVGLTATGLALVIPACVSWGSGIFEEAFRRGRERVEDAKATFGEFAGRAQERVQHHVEQATKNARNVTSVAAGAVESAARHVREHTS
ncbi:MAG: hypothetical protein JO270_18910 [Acidobacteriaceae bacterium]|nr:hypothetical protein [Acidobacteriaceae bacterium]MBV8569480.1 hypothetical protein [Acidobacteriaceae bacterium]